MFLTLVGDVHSEADHHVDQYCYHFHGPVGEPLDPQRLHGLLERALKMKKEVDYTRCLFLYYIPNWHSNFEIGVQYLEKLTFSVFQFINSS